MPSFKNLLADRPLGKLPFSLHTAWSYGVDWSIYLFFAAISIILGRLFQPTHEYFVQDVRLQYSYRKDETFPIWQLVTLCIIVPPFLFLGVSVLDGCKTTRLRIFWDTFMALTALCGSMAAQILIVCVIKNSVGLPRPDFLARCEPGVDYGRATIDDCTGRNYRLIDEGFRTFPSGHSSTAFAAMTMVSMFSAGKLQAFDHRGMSPKLAFALAPMVLACAIAASRIRDNRHFLSDTIAGGVIGAGSSWWFYRQYFPSVFHLQNNGQAYPPRRVGVAAMFGNVGGFWFLGGIQDDRCLNLPRTAEKLCRLLQVPAATSVGESIHAAEHAVNKLGQVDLDRLDSSTNAM